MAAIDFPSNPVLGQKFTAAGITYEWNGQGWKVMPSAPPGMVSIADIPPFGFPGDLWWESDTGTLWIKYKDATSEQWVQAAGSAGIGSGYVATAGDVMTGDLVIRKPQAFFGVDTTTVDGRGGIHGWRNGLNRWSIYMPGGDAETGANAGGSFAIQRYDDAGSTPQNVLQISRADGKLSYFGRSKFFDQMEIESTINPTLVLSAATQTSIASIISTVMGSYRWQLTFNNTANSDFAVHRYNDLSAFVDTPFYIDRTFGRTHMGIGPFAEWHAGVHISAPGGGVTAGDGAGGISIRIAVDNAAGTNALLFSNAAGAAVGGVSVTGTSTSYITSSAAELKEDLKAFDAGAIIDGTEVYDFKWKESKERAYGVVAQQAAEVYPAAVVHAPEQNFWGVDYSKYVPVLLQELKALRARVAELEGRPSIDPKKG